MPLSKDYPKEINTLGDHLRKRRLDLGRRVFEEVSRLPCHKQQRILGIFEDLIAAQRVQK
jgi:hypothetical protein